MPCSHCYERYLLFDFSNGVDKLHKCMADLFNCIICKIIQIKATCSYIAISVVYSSQSPRYYYRCDKWSMCNLQGAVAYLSEISTPYLCKVSSVELHCYTLLQAVELYTVRQNSRIQRRGPEAGDDEVTHDSSEDFDEHKQLLAEAMREGNVVTVYTNN